jgi:hypothetical protein
LGQACTDRFRIPRNKRKEKIELRNFAGELVTGAGEAYSAPLLLQHMKHYTREVFEIAPQESGVDIFLPYWWIANQAPQGPWDSPTLRFDSSYCQENCTKTSISEFPLQLDQTVLQHPEAQIIGYISAVSNDPCALVSEQFHQFLDVMGKEIADALPEHRPYDHAIQLKEGEVAPWGPIYPLSEAELETLREWIKEMLKTGKIRRSKSSASSPILFVPKPHNRGLRLCVDYRGLNRITVANRYPLPLMTELQDRIRGA